MILPPTSDPLWRDLIMGKLSCNFEFMPTKVLLTRIKASVSYDQTRIQSGIEELRSLFLKNALIPKVQNDLQNIFGSKHSITTVLHTKEEIIHSLAMGKSLLLAGSESTLSDIPKGSWIGGTAPLIGGLQLKMPLADQIFAAEIPTYHSGVDIKVYKNMESLQLVYKEAPENGFSVIIIPTSGSMHLSFALEAPHYPDFATRPLAGWIAGVPLAEVGKLKPYVYNGLTAEKFEEAAVVMAVKLPKNKVAEVGVVNIFKQGDGDILRVDQDGFEHQTVIINGQRSSFANYVKQSWIDTRLPLVADYHGLMVNTSFQKIISESKAVRFYAPLFRGIDYRIAKSITNYKNAFLENLPKLKNHSEVFSFNCILNYILMLDLETERPDTLLGPTTYGEVAYQLLNQTLAYVTIKDLD